MYYCQSISDDSCMTMYFLLYISVFRLKSLYTLVTKNVSFGYICNIPPNDVIPVMMMLS